VNVVLRAQVLVYILILLILQRYYSQARTSPLNSVVRQVISVPRPDMSSFSVMRSSGRETLGLSQPFDAASCQQALLRTGISKLYSVLVSAELGHQKIHELRVNVHTERQAHSPYVARMRSVCSDLC
jgi:hypothetical protein